MCIRDSYDSYLADKAKVYERTQMACLYNAEQIETERMVENADVVEGCRAVGFTTLTPAISMLGVVEGLLVDRAFIEERRDSAAELASMTDLGALAPRHMVANALAAAGLVRAYGVEPKAVRQGIQDYVPAGTTNRYWAKFPAPPAAVKTINIFFTNSDPFEGVAITDKP